MSEGSDGAEPAPEPAEEELTPEGAAADTLAAEAPAADTPAADAPTANAPAADTRAAETPAETEPAAVDWRSDWSDPSRNSAVKVQAMARGKSARALVANRKAQKRYSEHSHAARVQAAQRGKAARTRMKQLRNSAAATAEAPAEPVAPPAEAPAEAPSAPRPSSQVRDEL